MSEREKETVGCCVCGARVNELRRGRCWGCYTEWAVMRPVGQGACCVVCNERRRDSLRLMEVHGQSLSVCYGCAARVVRLEPVPYSIEGLRGALRRDRRYVERRGDGLDQRVFPRERRSSGRRCETSRVEDGLPPLPSNIDELVVELGDSDIDVVEETCVVQMAALVPQEPSPTESSEAGA